MTYSSSSPVYSASYNQPYQSNTYASSGYGSEETSDYGRRAHIRVLVPQNAEIWFDDNKTQQQGHERVFVSPPLEPGKTFHYNIRAEFNKDGQEQTVQRKVPVHAGDFFTVDLSQGQGMDTGTEPMDRDLNRPAPRTTDRDLDPTTRPGDVNTDPTRPRTTDTDPNRPRPADTKPPTTPNPRPDNPDTSPPRP